MTQYEIENLSIAEKILLVEKIWDSIDKSVFEITKEQKKELDKRLAKHYRGESEYRAWEEVKHRISNR